MKLASFEIDTLLGPTIRVGVESAVGIVDATAARIAYLAQRLPFDAARRIGTAQTPPDLIEVLGTGPQGCEWIAEALDDVLRRGIDRLRGMRIVHAADQVQILSPLPRPPGLTNFSAWPQHIAHAAAHGIALENLDELLTYWKGNPDSFIGTGVSLQLPSYATELDVECELAAVIGIASKDMSFAEAQRSIAGYTILNDVSVRDIQIAEMKSGRGPAKGKDFDGGNVLGPWLVTPDEIGDVSSLRLSLHVNGRELSSASAGAMSPTFPELVAYLSKGQMLKPGHVVTAGCYHGGSGFDLHIKLNRGDLIEMRISRIGSLVNRIAP